MKETWHRFGEDDPVELDRVRQAGATGIASALHELAGVVRMASASFAVSFEQFNPGGASAVRP